MKTLLAQNPNYRAPSRTKIGKIEAAELVWEVLAGAGYCAGGSSLAIAKALGQALFETAEFTRCYNHNWGNVRARAGRPYTMIPGSEILKGKTVKFKPGDPLSCFASYDTAAEGCAAYLGLILTKDRYAKSRAALFDDNVTAYDFAAQLGSDGYYTASKPVYAAGVRRKFFGSIEAACLAVGDPSFDRGELEELIRAEPGGVKGFQARAGLAVDGALGDQTRGAAWCLWVGGREAGSNVTA